MIKLFVVEDSHFVRDLLVAELSRQEGFSVMGSAGSGEEALREIPMHNPDIVIMDINMPGKDGIETTRDLKKLHPECKVIILTSSPAREDLFRALEAGASGFVSKESPHSRLLEAIRVVYDGHTLIDPIFTTHLIKEFVQFRQVQMSELPKIDTRSIERLTMREIEILYLIGQGKSNAEIAGKLNVAEVTVKSHVHQLLRKLSMTSRMQLAIFANEIGLKETGLSPPKG